MKRTAGPPLKSREGLVINHVASGGLIAAPITPTTARVILPTGNFQRVRTCAFSGSAIEKAALTAGDASDFRALTGPKRLTAGYAREIIRELWSGARFGIFTVKRARESAPGVLHTEEAKCARTTLDNAFSAATARRKVAVNAMRAFA